MSKTPKVSIGLPVYNGADYLEAAIRSLLEQTFEDFELIIVDNASTDETEKISRSYARRDPRVRYVRNEETIGAAGNFNKAFRLARAPYFKWAANDDVCSSTFLEQCVAVLDEDPNLVLAYTETDLIDEEGAPLPYDTRQQAFIDSHGKPWYWRFKLQTELASADPITRFGSVLHRTTWCLEVFGVIRRSALEKTSLIRPFFGSDKVLLSELSLHGRFYQVPLTLFHRRCHPQQSTYKSAREKAQWISGERAGRIVLPQWKAFLGYLGAVRSADLSLRQKLAGAVEVLKLAFRPDKLKRFFVPGPENYFGIGADTEPDHPDEATESLSLDSAQTGPIHATASASK